MRARTIRSGSFLKLYAKGRHIMNRLMTLLALLAVALSLGGCAAAGQLAQDIGGGLTNYSNRGGVLSGATGIAGNITTDFGKKFSGDKKVAPPAAAAAAPTGNRTGTDRVEGK